jgi:hypothetical protein
MISNSSGTVYSRCKLRREPISYDSYRSTESPRYLAEPGSTTYCNTLGPPAIGPRLGVAHVAVPLAAIGPRLGVAHVPVHIDSRY